MIVADRTAVTGVRLHSLTGCLVGARGRSYLAWVPSVCGIAGQVASGTENVDPPLIRRMTRALAHRGPDGERLYFDRQCGLGHRRLSLIDLEGGAPTPQQ